MICPVCNKEYSKKSYGRSSFGKPLKEIYWHFTTTFQDKLSLDKRFAAFDKKNRKRRTFMPTDTSAAGQKDE